MNILITMAGEGARFKAAGYSVPKFQIKVRGQSLFSWALKSLDDWKIDSNHFIFISQRKHDAVDFIEKECKNTLEINNYSVMEIEKITDGQATSALIASKLVRNMMEPICIYNIDTFVEPTCLKMKDVRGDGWMPCFPGAGTGWSFAKIDGDHKIIEVREKVRISDYASIGLYWFSSFSLYKILYNSYYSSIDNIEKGERYVAPLFNQLIKLDKPSYITPIPAQAVHPLGTPEEVTIFSNEK